MDRHEWAGVGRYHLYPDFAVDHGEEPFRLEPVLWSLFPSADFDEFGNIPLEPSLFIRVLYQSGAHEDYVRRFGRGWALVGGRSTDPDDPGLFGDDDDDDGAPMPDDDPVVAVLEALWAEHVDDSPAAADEAAPRPDVPVIVRGTGLLSPESRAKRRRRRPAP